MTYLMDTNTFVHEYETVMGIEYLVVTLYREGKKIALTTKARSGNDHKDRLEAQQALIGSNNNGLPIQTF